MNFSLKDFQVESVIGSGSFGTCYKVRNLNSHETCVWKAIDYSRMSRESKKMVCEEVNALSSIHHPHIVRYLGRMIERKSATLYILLEYCEGGDLAQVIRSTSKCGKSLDEEFVWRAIYQLSKALEHIHVDHSLVHRDVKSANVMLSLCRTNLKLGDFGLVSSPSILIPSDKSDQMKRGCSTSVAGSLYYISPEVIKTGRWSFKSDIWSLGCVAYEMCCLNSPFTGITTSHIISNIQAARYERIPSSYSDSLRRITEWMLTTDVSQRPSATIILRHPAVVVANQSRNTRRSGIFKVDMSQQARDNLNQPITTSHRPGDFDRTNDISNRNTNYTHRPNTAASSSTSGMGSSSSFPDDLNLLFDDITLDRQPEEVSNTVFQHKWLSKLESVRWKQAEIKGQVNKLKERERSLDRREKRVALLERQAQENVTRAQVYLNRCKDSKSKTSWKRRDRQVEDCSDPTYASASPKPTTIAKLDLSTLPKPNFGPPKGDRHVRFRKSLSEPTIEERTQLSYIVTNSCEGSRATAVKGLQYSSCRIFNREEKENRRAGSVANKSKRQSSASRLSMRCNNIV